MQSELKEKKLPTLSCILASAQLSNSLKMLLTFESAYKGKRMKQKRMRSLIPFSEGGSTTIIYRLVGNDRHPLKNPLPVTRGGARRLENPNYRSNQLAATFVRMFCKV
ncbi:hypothetical protein TNCT_636511 [Trichonephila clavata]|uniref:Uncharacterized protein n=1 Tax=Trichonephila clavata TaxID=2740835 RepID=A0A8X6FQW4_TRICU|nr:hypothetical protein TNCT_636511 [Trichonephila clavata]